MHGRPQQTGHPIGQDPTWPPSLHLVSHPQFAGGQARASVLPAPNDDEEATAQTIALMAQYAREDSLSPIVREAAFDAARTAGDNSIDALLQSVFTWIQSRIRFQLDSVTAAPVAADPEQTEVLIRPVDLLTMPRPAEDCDGYSMLCAAVLRALGINSSFRTVAADASAPDRYTHVYVVAHTPGGDVAMDTSHGDRPGWEVRPVGKTRTWRLDNVQTQLGAIDWGELLKIGAQTGAEIAKNRFGQPPPGTYIQKGDQVFFRQPEGASSFAFPGAALNVGPTGNTGTLLLIVAVVAGLVLLSRK